MFTSIEVALAKPRRVDICLYFSLFGHFIQTGQRVQVVNYPDRIIGCLFESSRVQIILKLPSLRKLSELPMTGNPLGDFYIVEGQAHIFVWATAWVDP